MDAGAHMFVYKRLASPLHATRAGVGALWSIALALAALAGDSPIVLLLVLASIVAAGALAGVGRELARSLRVAAIVAVPIVAVNVLVSREGLTVFARLGDLGPFGQGDLTVEALLYGATIALKVTILMLATTLASLAVDPDELLRAARRLSFRSALTASLATRMLPVLAGDARRLAEAQRTRPPAAGATAGARGLSSAASGATAGALVHSSTASPDHGAPKAPLRARARERATLISAVVASSLDRALDVAATLELRGFAYARRAPRQRRAWSRHDLAFAISTVALLALTFTARLADIAPFRIYPEVRAGAPDAALALGCCLALLALLPFADRRGIEP
jgi:energy-coupling factor transport system permease protein